MVKTIKTPRPPVSLLESAGVTAGANWQPILEVPLWIVEEPPDTIERDSAIVVVGGLATNLSDSASVLEVRKLTTAPRRVSATLTAGSGDGSDRFEVASINTSNNNRPITVWDWASDSKFQTVLPEEMPGGNNYRMVSWSPNSRYMALAHNFENHVSVYDWADPAAPALMTPGDILPNLEGIVDDALCVGWSGSGGALAIGHQLSPHLTVLDWTPPNVTPRNPSVGLPGRANDLAWFGNRLAVGHAGEPYLSVFDYAFGGTFTPVPGTWDLPNQGVSLDWSHDGRYLAVSHWDYPFLAVFDWESGTPVKLPDPQFPPLNASRGELSWRPGTYTFTVVFPDTPFIRNFQVVNDQVVKLDDPTPLPPGKVQGIAWSPDARYLIVGHNAPPYDYDPTSVLIKIYDYSATPPVEINDGQLGFTTRGSPTHFQWSPNGNFLAATHSYDRYGVLHIGPDWVSLKDVPGTELLANNDFEDVSDLRYDIDLQGWVADPSVPGWMPGMVSQVLTVFEGRIGYAIPENGTRWLRSHRVSQAYGDPFTSTLLYQNIADLTPGETLSAEMRVIGVPNAPRGVILKWNGERVTFSDGTDVVTLDRADTIVPNLSLGPYQTAELPIGRFMLTSGTSLEVRSRDGRPVSVEISYIVVTEAKEAGQ